MSSTKLQVSAQFGGRDAASAVLPHFHRLKTAAEGLVIADFPYSVFGVILRVDGEISSFEPTPDMNLRVSTRDDDVSVDVVISTKAWGNGDEAIETEICDGLRRCGDVLADSREISSAALKSVVKAVTLLGSRYSQSYDAWQYSTQFRQKGRRKRTAPS